MVEFGRKAEGDPSRLPLRALARSWTSGLLFPAFFLVLVGCAGDSGSVLDDDPIRGGGRIPNNVTVTGGARGVSATSEGDGTPTLPPVQASSAPAALAVGAVGVGREPQSPSDAGVKLGGPRSSDGTQPPGSGRSTHEKAPLPGGAAPVIGANAGTIVPTAAVVPSAQPATGTYEQLQQQLLARGVSWQQLKTGTARDEWVFACAIPHPQQNNMEQHYEARAVGPGGLAAIRAVLVEIDKERAGQ